jgi:PXPV repeat (3 copies)
MRKLVVGLLITGSLGLACTPRPAVAGSGEVAAGVVGGLAVGTLFGAAVASGPRYYAPAPVYVAPAPVYGPTCYWTRGAPVWDGYRGIWYRPRIQVCD